MISLEIKAAFIIIFALCLRDRHGIKSKLTLALLACPAPVNSSSPKASVGPSVSVCSDTFHSTAIVS